MTAYQLAQINIGVPLGPVGSPVLADFVAALEPINRIADQSPGFVWRLQTPEGDATAPWIQPAYAGKRIVTTKPGEHIRYQGELRKVAGVSIYRALPLPPAIMPG